MIDSDEHFCLVCNRPMGTRHDVLWSDYYCSQDDHHFFYRTNNGRMIFLRVRLDTGDDKLFLKVYYQTSCSEVWSRSACAHRIRINRIIVPDFTNLDKLKNKIKTYLLFS